MKSRKASRPADSLSMMNGMSTERETMEATETKRKSGMRKAA